MGKKLIMIIEGVIIAALVVGVVMIQSSGQSKIKSLENENQNKITSLKNENEHKIELLEDEKGKVSSQYETVLSDLLKSQASLNEAINLMKTEAFQKEYLIPESVVLEKALNCELMAKKIAQSTYTVTYSKGKNKARRGKIVILGKEKLKDGNDYYVGFTTRCAVSLDRPYRDEDLQKKPENELIILHGRNNNEWYQVDGTMIFPDEQPAAVNFDPDIAGKPECSKLSVIAKQKWQGKSSEGKDIYVEKGEKITIQIDEGQTWDAGKGKCGPGGSGGPEDLFSAKRPDGKSPLGALLVRLVNNEGDGLTKPEPISKTTEWTAPAAGYLSFRINDNDNYLPDNFGSLDIKIWQRSESMGKRLQDLKENKSKSVIIDTAPFGDDDIALVYFRINEGDSFGYNLGFKHPTNEALDAVKGSRVIFGIKFVWYCEQCHHEIQSFPDELREQVRQAYGKGVKDGKELARKEIIGDFCRIGFKMVSSILTCGMTSLMGEGYSEIANVVAQQVSGFLVEFLYQSGGKETLAEVFPSLKEELPNSILEFMPRQIPPNEISKQPDKFHQLAGIELTGDTQVIDDFLKSILGGAENITAIPAGGKNNQENYLLADGQFVNQLLVIMGLAKVPRDYKGPFAKELKQSEQKAKNKGK